PQFVDGALGRLLPVRDAVGDCWPGLGARRPAGDVEEDGTVRGLDLTIGAKGDHVIQLLFVPRGRGVVSVSLGQLVFAPARARARPTHLWGRGEGEGGAGYGPHVGRWVDLLPQKVNSAEKLLEQRHVCPHIELVSVEDILLPFGCRVVSLVGR